MLPYLEIDDLIQHMMRSRPTIVSNADTRANSVVFPCLAVCKLKALRLWMDYCVLYNQPMDLECFDDAVVLLWLRRVDELRQFLIDVGRLESSTLPALTSFKKEPDWKEQMLTYLPCSSCAAASTPSNYVVHAEMMNEMRAVEYNTLDIRVRDAVVLDRMRAGGTQLWLEAIDTETRNVMALDFHDGFTFGIVETRTYAGHYLPNEFRSPYDADCNQVSAIHMTAKHDKQRKVTDAFDMDMVDRKTFGATIGASDNEVMPMESPTRTDVVINNAGVMFGSKVSKQVMITCSADEE